MHLACFKVNGTENRAVSIPAERSDRNAILGKKRATLVLEAGATSKPRQQDGNNQGPVGDAFHLIIFVPQTTFIQHPSSRIVAAIGSRSRANSRSNTVRVPSP